MSDLMVLAFQTDTTRVATLAVGSDEAHFPGVVTVGYEHHCHTLEHQGNAGRPEDADPISREACRQIHAWYTELFAEMVKKMKGIDEGGSSLLDNTMLLYTSYMADGGHGTKDYPALLVGKAGGTLEDRPAGRLPEGHARRQPVRRDARPHGRPDGRLPSATAGRLRRHAVAARTTCRR